MTSRQTLDTASQRAAMQRRRLRQVASTVRDRLMPARLADDAKTGARAHIAGLKQDTVAHIRTHPVRTVLGLTALLAWMLRKPLMNHAPSAISRAYAVLSGKLAFSEWMADRRARVELNDAAADDAAADNGNNEELPHG